jgi:hypothetical protein
LDIRITCRHRFRFVVAALISFANRDQNRFYCALDCIIQPLADNLQSTTYQTFEQDPIKYNNYEEATFQALREWPKTSDRMCVLLTELRAPCYQSDVQSLVCSGRGERSASGSCTEGDIAGKTERVHPCCGKESKRVCDVSDLRLITC